LHRVPFIDRGRRAAAASITILSLVLLSGTPRAQEPAVHTTLQGVTATAAKSARDPLDLAESVSVVDREAIEAEQPQQVGDLLEGLPNVSIGGGARGIAQEVVIRGITDNRILFLLDGARQNFNRAHNARSFVDPELLQQVEVLRGPASALWGSGALGGVVALTTKDAADLLAPGQRAGARLKTGYQDVNAQWRGSASAYGLVGDSLDLLFDVSYRDADDTQLGDGSTLTNSAYENLSGLGKISFAPGLNHNFSLTAQSFDEEGQVPSNPQTPSTPDTLLDRDTQQRNLSLRYDYASGDSALLRPSVLVYRNVNDIAERRLVDGREDETELVTMGADLRNVARLQALGATHQVTGGVDIYRDEAQATRDGVPRPSFPDAEQEVLGVYLQSESFLGERWTLVPGLRWDDYSSRSNTDVAPDQDASEVSAKLAVSYRLSDAFTLHALYNEAFRAPGVSELFVSGTHFTCGPGCANVFVPNPDLRPEKAHNTELGVAFRERGLRQGRDELRARVNVFRNDVDDFIDQIVNFVFVPVPGNPGPGGTSFFENVSDARLEGFELELAYDAPRWYARVGYGQTRGEDRDSGEPLSSVPADEATLAAGLRWPAQGLSLGWRGRYVAEQDRVPVGGTPTPSYDLHDLSLSWLPRGFGDERLRVDLGVDNLLDEDYRPHLSVLKGPGRNVKASVALRF
jgi:hemoglobin/transferrin/lactoferrin receptor protein